MKRVDGALHRHKAPDGTWCSGKPKRTAELVLELLVAVEAERAVLRTMIDRYIDFGDALAEANDDYTDRQATSLRIIREITASVERDVEAMKTQQPQGK